MFFRIIGLGLFLGLFCLNFIQIAAAESHSQMSAILSSVPGHKIQSSLPRVARKFRQNYDFKFDPKTGEILKMILKSEDEIPLDEMNLPFSIESIQSGDFVLQKAQYDEQLGFVAPRGGRAPWSQIDDAENLVGALKYRKLSQMESRGLTAGRLKRVPWSSSYWPTYAGGIGQRYADPEFRISKSWKKNIERLEGLLPGSLTELTPEQIDVLSPAEKYDLLVGDPHFTLTRSEFAAAAKAASNSGKVESWEGKCHGWAPAAFSEYRPHHSIDVRAFDSSQPDHLGVSVKFYPDDIKALATLLWANSPSRSRFVGSRCNVKKPRTDKNGRILEEGCFDTNPGTWHLLTVNQIGVNRKSFVLDATYDYQVWNQPAFSYEYDYFDPQDAAQNWDSEDDQKFKKIDSWKAARVGLADFSADRFKPHRSPDAASVVGVHMKFTYVSEKNVSHAEVESAGSSALTSVHYYYDLELNTAGEIIGGEWYQLEHPDFIWAPVTQAFAVGDEVLNLNGDLNRWKKREMNAIPSMWRAVALESSAIGQPLGRIVSELIQKSRKYPGYTVLHFLFGWLESKND